MPTKKFRHINIVLDVSGSMNEKEPGTNKKKKEVALEHIVEGICNLVRDPRTWNEMASKASRTILSISYFGTGKTGGSLLLLDPILLEELRRTAVSRKCDDLKKMLSEKVKKLDSDGTSAIQLVNGIVEAVQKAMDKYAPDKDSRIRLRLVTLIYSDACFNMFESGISDPYTGTSHAKAKLLAEIQRVLTTKPNVDKSEIDRVLRGIILLLYGDPNQIESDTGICPKRAALLASRKDELPDAVRRSISRLMKSGDLKLESDLAGLEVTDDTKVQDYAVARIEKPTELAAAIATITTSAAAAG